MSVYLYCKTKLFLKAFFCDICGVQELERVVIGRVETMAKNYFWTRVEFTSTRGMQHWHCLAKLPNVLEMVIIKTIIRMGE